MKQKFEQIPTTDIANYLIFSMHSLEGIQGYLDNFPDGKTQYENKGCSATLIWSGTEENNTPVNTYSDKNPFGIGFVLNPKLLNTPQADLFAMNSGGLIVEELLKKDDKYNKKPLVTNDPNKAGYYRYGLKNPTFTTNLAKHEKLSPGNSIYHPVGRHDILAKNIWRKFFHKPEKYAEDGLMKYNEVICFQKEEINPIAGLLVSQEINQATAKALLNHFVANPHLKLYFYDKTAKEHIVRFIDNTQAKAYLQTISQKGQTASEFKTAFARAQKFQGYDQSLPSPTLLTDRGAMEKSMESIHTHINKIIQYAAKIASIKPILAFKVQNFGNDLNGYLEKFKKTRMTKVDFKNFSESVNDRVNEFANSVSDDNFNWDDFSEVKKTVEITRKLLAAIKKVCPQIPDKREETKAQLVSVKPVETLAPIMTPEPKVKEPSTAKKMVNQPPQPKSKEETTFTPGTVRLKYSDYTLIKGRTHHYNMVSSKENFKNDEPLRKQYGVATGDILKSKILDNFKGQINGVRNRKEFLELEKKLLNKDNPETNVLRQAQGAFFSFFSCFGLQTTSMDALNAMLEDRQKDFPEEPRITKTQ